MLMNTMVTVQAGGEALTLGLSSSAEEGGDVVAHSKLVRQC